MNKDQVKGTLKHTAGKVQEEVGKLTGSPAQELKGLHKQTLGQAQKLFGNAKQVLSDATHK